MKWFVIIFLFYNFNLSAQIRPVLSQYMLHQSTYNPGYSDPDTRFAINGFYKRQWVTHNNFPEAGIIYGHYNLNESHGVGAVISNDLMNGVNFFEFGINYTYNIPVFYEANLGLGLKAAFSEQNLLNKSLIHFDPEPLLDNSTTFTYLNAGLGLSLTSPRFNLFVSAPYLFGNSFLNQKSTYTLKNNQFYLNIGYKFRNDDWFIFYPTALITAVQGATIHGKFNSNFLISQLVWAGLGVSTDLTLNVCLGVFSMGGIRVVYSVDTSILTSHKSTGITHEFSLSYAKTLNQNPFHKRRTRGVTGGYNKK
ncbi:MAG: PorP/SprF family type IX secretion system membrane protein [Flavobacteriia bacterium]|nr:PorP/SprF family type IX secretion system membrane protein [Flavobacteriia bacterium]